MHSAFIHFTQSNLCRTLFLFLSLFLPGPDLITRVSSSRRWGEKRFFWCYHREEMQNSGCESKMLILFPIPS